METSEESPLMWTRNYAIQKFCQSHIHGLVAVAGAKEMHSEFEKVLIQGLKDTIWKTNTSSTYARP